jgi:hypothetical protein
MRMPAHAHRDEFEERRAAAEPRTLGGPGKGGRNRFGVRSAGLNWIRQTIALETLPTRTYPAAGMRRQASARTPFSSPLPNPSAAGISVASPPSTERDAGKFFDFA